MISNVIVITEFVTIVFVLNFFVLLLKRLVKTLLSYHPKEMSLKENDNTKEQCFSTCFIRGTLSCLINNLKATIYWRNRYEIEKLASLLKLNRAPQGCSAVPRLRTTVI